MILITYLECMKPSFSFAPLLIIALLLPACHNSSDESLEAIKSPNPKGAGYLEKGGQFGATLASMADVNGDDTQELLVGAPGEEVDGKPGAGRVYLLDGSDGSVLQTWHSPRPKGQVLSSGFVDESGGKFGAAVASPGDLNGDGLDDVVVGAPVEEMVVQTENLIARTGDAKNRDTVATGRAYVISGADGSVLHQLTTPNPAVSGQFGGAVARVGDIDEDRYPDFVIGAGGESLTEALGEGRAYLFSGMDGDIVHTLKSSDPVQSGGYGQSVAGVGDVTGDRIPDVVVGAPYESFSGVKFAGRVYVVDSKSGTVTQTLSRPNGLGAYEFGRRLDGIRDVDGDATPDLVIGVPRAGHKRLAGEIHLRSAQDGSSIRTLRSPRGSEKEASFGSAVEGIDDVTGDGVPDVLVGEKGAEVEKHEDAGMAYLIDGVSGDSVRTFRSPNPKKGGNFGDEVSLIRQGDGEKKVAVGAPGESIGEKKAAGRVYIFDLEPEAPNE